jgi:NAD(P)H-dependent flavin oxidoreductase YrpB (nitropropane dioxygenase family)
VQARPSTVMAFGPAGGAEDRRRATTRAGALPRVIQGGMGVAVSGWRLASTVSRMGQLGVVSGTALAVVLARGLQDGDRGGHLRRGLSAFVDRAVAARILERYFRPDGRRAGGGYRAVPVPRQRPSRHFLELTVAGSFVEVYLAKEGHGGPVGINLLEKIQIPTLPSLYGAMLAGVDWVLMGAGIPRRIPAALEALADHRPVSLPLAVADGAAEDDCTVAFDPRGVVAEPAEALSRPRFMAIVGSHVLAAHLARDEESRPAGFVVERPTAGGHNAPPRGALRLSAEGEPVYGPRDDVDLARMRRLGVPFWLAGGYAHPAKLREALAEGARGVQIGTAFALCEESGLDPALKRRAREQAAAGRLLVHTDPVASPTGYPFKVARVQGTAADPEVHAARRRRCDLSYLATPYRRSDGTLGYRCPAEPVDDYVAKGGQAADTAGRVCLCNGLLAAVGLPQRRRDGGAEPPLLTLGDDARAVMAALSPDGRPYRAEDVVRHLLDGGVPRVGGSAVDAEALEAMSDQRGSAHRSVAAGGAEEELCL